MNLLPLSRLCQRLPVSWQQRRCRQRPGSGACRAGGRRASEAPDCGGGGEGVVRQVHARHHHVADAIFEAAAVHQRPRPPPCVPTAVSLPAAGAHMQESSRMPPFEAALPRATQSQAPPAACLAPPSCPLVCARGCLLSSSQHVGASCHVLRAAASVEGSSTTRLDRSEGSSQNAGHSRGERDESAAVPSRRWHAWGAAPTARKAIGL